MPPVEARLSSAFWIAAVSSVTPSPLAPKATADTLFGTSADTEAANRNASAMTISPGLAKVVPPDALARIMLSKHDPGAGRANNAR